ncbi:hypothetical protein BUY98_14190 [Staphylococcus gallinarum]|nr:hypothetical protein BUY97_12230 [Staphylococcus gallinarum]RIL23763.1 hypothetical protein BUY99_04160 [Staphylococcus gallinarum]RIL27790.1 hypothetical protein BUY98_14190 [Staphylococcus gallinarum]RIL29809.1 hypothetical protein BUY95_03870 [Staphylococcus gallinarum]
MILSDTLDIRYKLNTNGMNTIEMAQLLKSQGVTGYLKYVNDHCIIVAVPREDIKRNRLLLEGIRNDIGKFSRKIK